MTDEKCSICREEMDGTMPDYLLRCNHRFHTECIIDSLRRNPECPVCRDRGTDVNDNSFEDDFIPFYTPEEGHKDNCFCCAVKDKNSELYETYMMITQIGNQNKDILKEYRTNYIELEKLQRQILQIYSIEDKKILEMARRYRQIIYRNIGYSSQYKEFKETKKRLKVYRNRLKNAICREFKELGYEIDSDFARLINVFIERQFKFRLSWRFTKLKINIQKYTLPKYAPSTEELIRFKTINNPNNILEI